MVDWSTDPAFCDDSVVLKSPDMNEIIHDLLGEIVVEHPAHFRSAVQSSSDIGCRLDSELAIVTDSFLANSLVRRSFWSAPQCGLPTRTPSLQWLL
jgi:hypothetical protein